MTKSELARDKLKYWSLISRANKVGFNIPSHWMKYGLPPTKPLEIVAVNLDAISDKLTKLFDRDDYFFSKIRNDR